MDDTDFQVLMSDEFYDLVKEINKTTKSSTETSSYKSFDQNSAFNLSPCSSKNGMMNIKKIFTLPKYDKNLSYDAEFYSLFQKNQQLLEEIDREAR